MLVHVCIISMLIEIHGEELTQEGQIHHNVD